MLRDFAFLDSPNSVQHTKAKPSRDGGLMRRSIESLIERAKILHKRLYYTCLKEQAIWLLSTSISRTYCVGLVYLFYLLLQYYHVMTLLIKSV